MPTGLGALLFGLMVLLAVAFISIIGAALREATLAPAASRDRAVAPASRSCRAPWSA